MWFNFLIIKLVSSKDGQNSLVMKYSRCETRKSLKWSLNDVEVLLRVTDLDLVHIHHGTQCNRNGYPISHPSFVRAIGPRNFNIIPKPINCSNLIMFSTYLAISSVLAWSNQMKLCSASVLGDQIGKETTNRQTVSPWRSSDLWVGAHPMSVLNSSE